MTDCDLHRRVYGGRLLVQGTGMYLNGREPVFQTGYAGSIPVIPSEGNEYLLSQINYPVGEAMYMIVIHDNVDDDITSGVFGPFNSEEDAFNHQASMKRFPGDEEMYYLSIVKVDDPKEMETYWREIHGVDD